MNLYLRYFENEYLAHSLDDALDFLASMREIPLDDYLIRSLTEYANGSTPYPKRFKVSARSYFIVIKTAAETLADFKAKSQNENSANQQGESEKEMLARTLANEQPGWYRATILFKRVIPAESNGKFQYVDTEFEVKLKAHSIQECYDRVVDHLRTRSDVDPRSQFPSIKGRNFRTEFLGMK